MLTLGPEIAPHIAADHISSIRLSINIVFSHKHRLYQSGINLFNENALEGI